MTDLSPSYGAAYVQFAAFPATNPSRIVAIKHDSTFARFGDRRMIAGGGCCPDSEFHFHRGPEYAAARLGDDKYELAQLPASVTAAFAGIGNPHAISRIEPGAVAAAGTNVEPRATHPSPRHIRCRARAIGIDITAAMRERATSGAQSCGLTNVDIRDGNAMRLPVEDSTVDVVIAWP